MNRYYELIRPLAEKHIKPAFQHTIECAKSLQDEDEGYFIANRTCACMVPITELTNGVIALERKQSGLFDRHLDRIRKKEFCLIPMIPTLPILLIHCKGGKITLLSDERFSKRYFPAIVKLQNRIYNINF